MKRILTFFLFLFLGIWLITFFNINPIDKITEVFQPPCTKPIYYAIGDIDPKFKVTEEDTLNEIKAGADIWNNLAGKQLFEYSPKANLKINLVYDERQATRAQLAQMEQNLQNSKDQIIPSEQKYNNLVADFNNRLSKLNSDIDYWNSQGGAPPDIYDKLKKEQASLKAVATQINSLAQQLNKSTKEYNVGVDNLNQTAQNLNEIIQNKPEEGIYDSGENKIEIYVDVDQKEFIHTVSHELGHALDLPHVSNPKSIMYEYTNTITKPSDEDTQALTTACTKSRFSFDRIKLLNLNQIISRIFELRMMTIIR